jgi:Na+/H+ antiporter NhaA
MTETDSRTPWHKYVRTPLRTFSSDETGGAAVLLAGTIAALLWVNINAKSYDTVWNTTLTLSLGKATVAQDLRGWVNSGLMTLFFLVVGLEARREMDIGELRERKRVTLPLLAGIAGMAVPVGLFLAFNGGRHSAHGWGAVMSTDTAFALGMLALVGPRFPDRLRAFMLTVVVVDDIVALLVIATVYTKHLRLMPLLIALALFACMLAIRAFQLPHRMQLYALFGIATWLALFKSGVDPVVVGLAMGLLTYAYSARRPALDLATEGFRQFREQPTAQLARQARASVEAAISPNDRLQQRFSPWTTYVIVPLFALANAGIPIGGHFLSTAVTSPITLGIVAGYVLGKPIGIIGMSWLVTAVTHRRLRPPVGLGCGGRSRLDRWHRFHGVTVDRFARLHRNAARASKGWCPSGRRAGVTADVADLPHHRTATAAPANRGAAGKVGGHRRSCRPGRRRARSHQRPAGIARDTARVRRPRMPLLRAG